MRPRSGKNITPTFRSVDTMRVVSGSCCASAGLLAIYCSTNTIPSAPTDKVRSPAVVYEATPSEW